MVPFHLHRHFALDCEPGHKNAAISMHATIMHFATCLPDWNSLDSVRRAHSDLEVTALVFFALLVVCEALVHLSDDKKTERRFEKISIVFFAIAVLAEIVAYPYGQRNDTLSEQIIGSLDGKARDALTKSETALSHSNEAETKSSEAVDKAGKAQEELRKATNEQLALQWHINLVAKSVSPRLIDRKRFIQLMRGQPNSSAEIWYEPSDDEAKFLAMQLDAALGKDVLGWDTTVGPFPDISPDEFHAQLRSEATGLNGLVYGAKTAPLDLDSPLRVLVNAIGSSLGGLNMRAMIFSNPQLPDGHFIIAVGHHVPSIPQRLPKTPKR